MGQWGAYGYASLAAYRWTDGQILSHYYGGTHLVPVAAAVEATPVDVDLSELDGSSSTILRANRRGAFVTVNGAKRWGQRTIVHTGRTLTVNASVGDLRVDLAGVWRSYQGSIVIQSDGQTWNVVPLEDYVAGVVPIESSAGWGATGGEAALQAQAVAARSYVLSYLQEIGHTCDNSYCQVYEGDPGTNPDIGSYVRYSDEATRSSAGLVVCRIEATTCARADVVSTQYASSSGGYTSGAGSPGFPAVVDAGDAVSANPWHDWTISLSVSSVEDAYPSVGSLTALKVSKRNGDGQMRGRAVTVTITGRKGSTSVDGEQFAEEFGLYSDWFRFSTQP
jgi:stage II sporulation protein D